MSDYATWKEFRRVEEGGWSNVRGDRGGETKWGVTKILLDHLHTLGKYPHIIWETMTEEQADEVARGEFWRDDLPWPVNLVLADFYFNSGGHAVKALQAEVGAEQDGALGPATLAKVASVCEVLAAADPFHRPGPAILGENLHVRRTRFIADIHQAGTIVKGEHDLAEETKFLEGLMVRLVRLSFLMGE